MLNNPFQYYEFLSAFPWEEFFGGNVTGSYRGYGLGSA